MDPYFEDCLQGLSHAEKVFRRCCETEIVRIQNDLKKSLWESLSCISRTDVKNLCNNGWQYTVTEHDCPGNTACNMFLKLCLKKLPWASKLNRNRVLRAMYLSSRWEFAKLFLEPWMHRLHGFEELDSFCLLVLLDNISSIRQDIPSDSERHKQWVDLYHAQLGKGRTLAEACFREDTQHLTEAERNNFLQAIINILACLLDEESDEVIGFIVEIRGMPNSDLASPLEKRTRLQEMRQEFQKMIRDTPNRDLASSLEKRTRLQEMRQEFQKMMKDFVSTIPKEDAQTEEAKTLDRDLETQSCFSKEPFVPGVKLEKGIVDRKQMYQNLEDSTLIRNILRMGDPVDLVYLFYKKRESESEYPRKGSEITEEKYLCIQGLINLLENNLATDITEIVCSLLGALKLSEFNLDVMPYSHYSKLQDVVKKMESTKPLKNLLQKEMEEANFKVCHQALLILESVLKPFCKNKLKRIHSDVKLCFTRTNLCQSANQNDICKANGMTSDKIKFKHDCKKTPNCNAFLEVSLSKRSDKCKLKPVAMFKYANPHACLDNEWEFAKLFMEPCMHKLRDFEDLDAFCLLTLITNVQMFDAVQCNSNMLLEKICKVRDSAFAILHDNDTKLSEETRDNCLQEIIDILTILKTTIPVAGKALFKIKQLSSGTLLFDIRLDLSSRKQWIISERNFSNWCKCVYALKYLQPALVPLVQEQMTNLYNDVINDFRRNICADAKSEDLSLKRKEGISFHHTCPKNEPPCDSLIDRIKQNFCLKSVSDIFNILKFTDPQNWLKTPFDFASLFIQTWMVQGSDDFSQCDISALCELVKNCRPVSEMFKEMPINNVKRMRNRTMHCAEFSISQIEMEERIDDILDLLRMMFKSYKRDEVAVAIDLVVQLRTSDFKFSCDESMRVYEETVASVKRRMHYKRDITCQSIKQMESDFGFISFGRNTNVSYCREHRHGQRKDNKEGWPLDRVFVSDEEDHTPTVTTTEMEWRQDSLPVKKHSDNISEATMDEDSGQGASSGASKPHDQGHENKCAKCGETGTVVSAAGFCRACSVYLCTNCLVHHKKSIVTQDHELQEIVPMPLEVIAPFDVERCKAHTSKPIEAYCADDDTFVCSLCLSISHRSCHNKGSLYDLSRGVESSQEFLDVKYAAEKYKMLENEYNDDIKLNLSRNDKWRTQTLTNFRSIDHYIYKVQTNARKIRQENKKKLNDLAESTAKFSEELKQHMATINKASQQNENQLFIALKKHGRRVLECLERMDTLHKEVLIKKFGFKFDPRTRKSLLKKRKVNIATFSRLTRTQSEEEVYSRMFTQSSPKILYTLATFLNIKSPEDSIDCNIMDIMELSPTELVMTDANNKCLKMLNTDSNKIIARCALDLQPKGIAKVKESVAVSFPQARQIRFYKADLTPDVRRAIDVLAECHGLHCSNNLLIVSCINPAQVQVLFVTGQPLRIIENNPEGTLFQKPFHSILKYDARLIYVSDFDKHTLTCINRVGIVQWEYRDEQLKGPEGVVTMDDGCICLCSRETNTIHVVSPNGLKVAVIPISNPCAAFYSNRNRTLYVCSESGNSENGNFIGVVNLL